MKQKSVNSQANQSFKLIKLNINSILILLYIFKYIIINYNVNQKELIFNLKYQK